MLIERDWAVPRRTELEQNTGGFRWSAQEADQSAMLAVLEAGGTL